MLSLSITIYGLRKRSKGPTLALLYIKVIDFSGCSDVNDIGFPNFGVSFPSSKERWAEMYWRQKSIIPNVGFQKSIDSVEERTDLVHNKGNSAGVR